MLATGFSRVMTRIDHAVDVCDMVRIRQRDRKLYPGLKCLARPRCQIMVDRIGRESCPVVDTRFLVDVRHVPGDRVLANAEGARYLLVSAAPDYKSQNFQLSRRDPIGVRAFKRLPPLVTCKPRYNRFELHSVPVKDL